MCKVHQQIQHWKTLQKKQKNPTKKHHKYEGFGVILKSEFVLKSDRDALAWT